MGCTRTCSGFSRGLNAYQKTFRRLLTDDDPTIRKSWAETVAETGDTDDVKRALSRVRRLENNGHTVKKFQSGSEADAELGDNIERSFARDTIVTIIRTDNIDLYQIKEDGESNLGIFNIGDRERSEFEADMEQSWDVNKLQTETKNRLALYTDEDKLDEIETLNPANAGAGEVEIKVGRIASQSGTDWERDLPGGGEQYVFDQDTIGNIDNEWVSSSLTLRDWLDQNT
jgi:hypothetical protein